MSTTQIFHEIYLLATGIAATSDVVARFQNQLNQDGNDSGIRQAINTYFNQQIPTQGGVHGVISLIASNGLGISLNAAQSAQVAQTLTEMGVQSWADLLTLCIQQFGQSGQILDQRSQATIAFSAALESQNKVSHYQGEGVLSAVKALIQSIGTDQQSQKAGQEGLLALVQNLSADGIQGAVVDGYVKEATVFIDRDGDGKWSEGEFKTTTDANGHFVLPNNLAAHQIVASGGTDIMTGKPFQGVLTAPNGATVINPITTLVQSLVASGQANNVTEATQSVARALGLPSGTSALSFDPLAVFDQPNATEADKANALKVQSAALQVMNIISQTAAALDGIAASPNNGQNNAQAVIKAIAQAVQQSTGPLDFGKVDTLTQIAQNAIQNSGHSGSSDQADKMAQVTAASNLAVQKAENIGELAKVAVIAQGETVNALKDAGGHFDQVVNNFTGDKLDTQVSTAKPEQLTPNTKVDDVAPPPTSPNTGGGGGGGSSVNITLNNTISDDTGPLTTPDSTDRVTSDTTPTLSGTAPAGSTVTLTATDGNTSQTLGQCTADNAGQWTFTPTNALNDGAYSVTASTGGSTSSAVNVIIDTTAPTFSAAVGSGNEITLELSEANGLSVVSNLPNDSGGFTVSWSGGSTTVTSVSVDGPNKTVTLTLEDPLPNNTAIDVSYTAPAAPTGGATDTRLQDIAGNLVADTTAALTLTSTTPDAPNVANEATQFLNLTTLTGAISTQSIDGNPDIADWYRIHLDNPVSSLTLKLSSAIPASITPSNANLTTLPPADLQLFTMDGQSAYTLAGQSISTTSNNTQVDVKYSWNSLNSGDYLIKVTPNSGRDNSLVDSDYTLSKDSLGANMVAPNTGVSFDQIIPLFYTGQEHRWAMNGATPITSGGIPADGTAAELKYVFVDNGASWDQTGLTAFSSLQKEAARAAFNLWAKVANITLTEDTSTTVNSAISTGSSATQGVIYLGNLSTPDVTDTAYFTGASESNGLLQGLIAVNTSSGANGSNNGDAKLGTTGNIDTTGYAFSTLVHEIGHALGLKHPGDYNGSGFGNPAFVNPLFDSWDYSIMSYLTPDTIGSPSYQAGSPMVLDIAALQYLYGSNQSDTSNSSYTYAAGQKIYETLWDAGGTDSINLSARSGDIQFDLEGGSVNLLDSVSSQNSRLNLAYGTVIENLSSGAGNDTLKGNDVANQIDGGAGNDTIYGANGGDTLNGEAGDDVLMGGAGSDSLDGGAGADIYKWSTPSDGTFNMLSSSDSNAKDTLSFVDGEDKIDIGAWIANASGNKAVISSNAAISLQTELSAAKALFIINAGTVGAGTGSASTLSEFWNNFSATGNTALNSDGLTGNEEFVVALANQSDFGDGKVNLWCVANTQADALIDSQDLALCVASFTIGTTGQPSTLTTNLTSLDFA